MPRTYTTSGVTIIGDGEESGVWGSLTNTNMQILDRMISQAGVISLSGTTHTLSISDGVLSDGQYAALVFGGSPSGTNTVTISPNDAQRLFFIKNNSGETVTLTQGSGGDVSILDGRSAVVYCDGAGSGAAVVNLSTTLVTETAQDIGALTPTDGSFIVGNGTTWVSEAGNTVLASLGVTATATELNTLDGITASAAELNILDGVTASTAEINILDGVTWTLTDYNTLTASAEELNLLDGKTLSGSDTEIVTGTAGPAGDIVQWNADGDLVSYGAATQGEATWEAGTGTTESLVSPAKVKAAIDALATTPIVAWVRFTGGVTPTILASDNVASVTRNGVGRYRVTFSSALSDANYAATVTGGVNTTNVGLNRCASQLEAMTTTEVDVAFNNHGNALGVDPNFASVIVVR